MGENLDNLVLEQLRLIREDFKRMDQRFDQLEQKMGEEFADVKTDLLGQQTMLFGLASVIGQIDKRVEHLEQKIGA